MTDTDLDPVTESDSAAIDSDSDSVTDTDGDPVMNCRESFCDR